MDAHRGAVLLVDDEGPVRRVAQRMLERQGYEVVAVAGGHEALQAFRQRDRAFGLVLLDWIMPGMDGSETCQRLRSIRPGVPIVFMSGASRAEIAERGIDAPVLRKPFSRDTLTRTVASLA